MNLRFYNLLRKFNHNHDSNGHFSTGNFKVHHATRYDEVTETKLHSNMDLGHFKKNTPRTIVSPKEISEDTLWHTSEDELISKLNPTERAALTEYTGARTFKAVNSEMVKGKTSDPKIFNTAKAIFTGISKSKIPEDVTLFRGMKARGVFLEGTDAIGKVYSDKVFKSTSLLHDNAIQFANHKEPAVILRIKARKGQAGAYLDGKLSQNPQEQEVLLPSNAKFLIVGHSILDVTQGKAKSKIHVYDVEML